MKKEEVIGLDIGYGFCKGVTTDQHTIFPSTVGPKRDFSFKVGGDSAELPGETVTAAGESYFVGKKAELCDTTFNLLTSNWVQSKIYLALLISLLMRVAESIDSSTEVTVVTGLPVNYMRDKAIVEEQVRCAAKSTEIQLKSVIVIPQPFGALFDYVLNLSGEASVPGKISLLGVVDIGYRTTDYVLVKNLEAYIERAAGTMMTGVFSIIDNVRRDLMHRYNRDNITGMEAEECIRRSKSIKIGGENIDVSDTVNVHTRNAAQTIIGEIKSRWAPEGELDTVLLSGGGSILLKAHLKDISHECKQIEGAQFANARGYFKHGLFLQKAYRTV